MKDSGNHQQIGKIEGGDSVTDFFRKQLLSTQPLTEILTVMTSRAMQLVGAESAELALFDQEIGQYKSALVIGKPIKLASQAMLSNAAADNQNNERCSPMIINEVLIEKLYFSGQLLGTLRVALKEGQVWKEKQIQVVSELAIKATLSLLTARYAEEMVRIRQRGEESAKNRTGFLANLSHEIRAPLGVILNAVDLVLDGLCGNITQDQRETLGMVKNNGQHLLDLINDVLDFAKLEAGAAKPEVISINLKDSLVDLANVISKMAEKKGHRIELDLEIDGALNIFYDKKHFRQIVINLLSNAIKYTPDRGVIILGARNLGGGIAQIFVRDNGVGIAASDRGKVFAPFERVDDPYSKNQSGAGLGLSLTKKLVELNGGIIDFESQLGIGTEFYFSAKISNLQAVASVVKSDEHLPMGNNERVLLIESSDEQRLTLERFLKSRGFDVFAAKDNGAALTALNSDQIDLVIVDNLSLEQGGRELIKRLSNSPKTDHIPVLLLSARAFDFDIEGYIRAGIDQCVAKPIDLKDLAQRAKNLLQTTLSKS
ncbi:MAG TPA: ATP-binding protein [Oligoflexia bacterium]|nr:ATP-binding protein [Oligoflexia bacterium]HMP27689.1 ATP-binding protein [Oligoflexia bacterium]